MTHLPKSLVQVYEEILMNHNWSQNTRRIWIDIKTDADWNFLINMFGDVFQMASGDWCGKYFCRFILARKVKPSAVVICKDVNAGIAKICLRYGDSFKQTKESYSNIYQFAEEWVRITGGSLNPIFKI